MVSKDIKFCAKICFMILMGLLVSAAVADRRSYVWTYEYQTLPKGESEIEYYLTSKIPDLHKYGNKNTWEHQVEYEYGITDRWDVAVYQRWQQTNTSSDDKFEYTGDKLRTRYRLGERGMYPFDTLLYLEYIKPDGSGETEYLEGKLVLSKDIGNLNLSYNQIISVPVRNGGNTENEYAAGVSYVLNTRWRISMESTGNLTEGNYYAGPTISWGNKKCWINCGLLRGLNADSDDMRMRLIVGIPF